MKQAQPIILIGPMSAGKSSVALELARLLGRPNVPMDRVRWYYYLQDGFDVVHESSLESFTRRVAYWKPFEVKAVKKIITEFPEAVIDFGAGHSYYADESHLGEVKRVLDSIKNIFLLLPCEDKKEALRICNQRLASKRGESLSSEEVESNREFIEGESNYLLAKHIVYNAGETPPETARKVRSLLVDV